MQFSPIKNQNFEKPSRNLSNRNKVKIFRKKILFISQKKFGSAYAQSPRNCSNVEILAKIEGKEAKFFRKFTKGIKGFDLGKKIINIISCLCTFNDSSDNLPRVSPIIATEKN